MSKAPKDAPIFGGEEAGRGSFEECRIAVLPAPLEATVSYGGGAGAGPRAILQSSGQLEFFCEETWRPYWTEGQVHTLPTVDLPPDPAEAVTAIAEAARAPLAAGKFLITLGGEHTVTAGAVRAVVEELGADDLGVLTIDAHLDLRDTYEGSPWSHACVLRRVHEAHGLPLFYAGIRSVAAEEIPFLESEGITPFFAHQLDREGTWIQTLVDRLPSRVYLSLDVDGLDPSVMPGTGTPEPGGLSYREVVRLLRAVAARRTIVAADCVEVAPIPGQQVSEFTAAKIIAKLIGALPRQ